MSKISSALNELLKLGEVNLPSGGKIDIEGHDPVYPTPFKLGKAAATALAAQGVAISAIWQQRSGRAQTIKVDKAAAAISLKSVAHLRQQGCPVSYPDPAYPLTDFFRCKDGRFIFLHAGYPKLRDGLLKLLNCPNDKDAITQKVAGWDSATLEDAVAEAKLCGGIARTHDEWLAHPQGKLLADMPVVEIKKIGDSAPFPFAPAARPLSDIKILDLTHVLAGPTCGRTLAEQGATVLRIWSPQQPLIPSFIMDTGHGKLSTLLDLTKKWDADCLRGLIGEADIFAESYRPGAITKLGFSPENIAAIRPGIIYLSLSCYGEDGPWGTRAGWEQLAQSVTGMGLAQGNSDVPVLSPVYPNDYISGYLAAYGITAALLKRAKEGGSYHVKISLCRTAMWLQSLGKISAQNVPPISSELLSRFRQTRQTPYGTLRFLGPITEFSETQAYWERPSVPLAFNSPVWPKICPPDDL